MIISQLFIILIPRNSCDLGTEQTQVALFLRALGAIGTKAFEQDLGKWYKLLGRLCQETGLPSSIKEMICSLVVAPLDVPHDLGVYHSPGLSPSYKEPSLTNCGRPFPYRLHQAFSLPKLDCFSSNTARSGAVLGPHCETSRQHRPRSAVKLYH